MMRVGILAGGVEMPAEHIVPPSQRLVISATISKIPDVTAFNQGETPGSTF